MGHLILLLQEKTISQESLFSLSPLFSLYLPSAKLVSELELPIVGPVSIQSVGTEAATFLPALNMKSLCKCVSD